MRFLPFNIGYAGHAGQAHGFRTRALLLRFPGYGPQDQRPAIDEGWLAGAELVVVRTTPQGSVDRRVRIPEFPLQPGERSASTSP